VLQRQRRGAFHDGVWSMAPAASVRDATIEDLQGLLELVDTCGLRWTENQIKVGVAVTVLFWRNSRLQDVWVS